MVRREVLALLCAGASLTGAPVQGDTDSLLGNAPGAALLIDIRSRRLMAAHNARVAGELVAPPGSTMKPFALAALLRARKLNGSESYACPGHLEIGGRSLNCSHPRLDTPMRVETALAYSCNCFVAHVAERFAAGELAADLEAAGLTSRSGLLGQAEVSGRVMPVASLDARRLQALGEDGAAVTLAGLAMAYRRLAMRVAEADMQAIRDGLTGAVAFGTAQRAAVPGMSVAGKTGSVRTADGAHIAWFAGYAPDKAPEVVVAVMLHAQSGGADAAPVAARILETWRKGR